MTQPDNSTPSLPWDDLTGEDLACLGMRRADDPFRDLFRDRGDLERAIKEIAKIDRREQHQRRKSRHKTALDQAKKAGATSVTVDGVTYTLGQAKHQTDTDRELIADDELERWRRKHAR